MTIVRPQTTMESTNHRWELPTQPRFRIDSRLNSTGGSRSFRSLARGASPRLAQHRCAAGQEKREVIGWLSEEPNGGFSIKVPVQRAVQIAPTGAPWSACRGHDAGARRSVT